MSFQLPMFIDPETGGEMPNAVVKMTAFRGHNEKGVFAFDGIEVSVYSSVENSKSKNSRLKFDISQLLAMAPPDAEGKAPVTTLDSEALGRVKGAMLKALYEEYGSMGLFTDAKQV